jgi:hypothetical protein
MRSLIWRRKKNRTTSLHGQLKRYKKNSIIILEGVADQKTWIWHAFIGMPGSCNDILQSSPLIAKITMVETPPVELVANGRTYNKGYYLAYGIYPKWVTFLKPC